MKKITGNAIILNYPPFGGGKFISNGLALSKYCVHIDHDAMTHLIRFPDDYEYRLHKSLSTIPNNSKEGTYWRSKYELNNPLLYGRGIPIFNNYNTKLISQCLDAGLDIFAISHFSPDKFNELTSKFTAHKIIRLIKFKKFWEIAQQLKKDDEFCPNWNESTGAVYNEETYNVLHRCGWPTWKEFEDVAFDLNKIPNLSDSVLEQMNEFYYLHHSTQPMFIVDVDQTYFSIKKLISLFQNLYNWLGYDDFNQDLIKQFVEKYVNFHKTYN